MGKCKLKPERNVDLQDPMATIKGLVVSNVGKDVEYLGLIYYWWVSKMVESLWKKG